MDINFELYKVFYYVAQNLSFSEASNRLYVSQSAVSQSIKTLEEKLGCSLFYRSTKNVCLTPEGKVLYQQIEQAYFAIKNGERKLSEMHSLEGGDVRIGASDTICKYYLLPFFRDFSERYPKVKIHVTNRPSPACIDLLQKGAVDVVVINLPEILNHDAFQVIKKREIQDIFIVGDRYDVPDNQVRSIHELTDIPLLALEKNTTTRHFLDNFLMKNGVSMEPEIELGSLDLLIDLVKINFGLSFVPKDYVMKELHSGSLKEVSLKEPIPSRQLGIVSHKKYELPIAAKEFIRMLEPKFDQY